MPGGFSKWYTYLFQMYDYSEPLEQMLSCVGASQ